MKIPSFWQLKAKSQFALCFVSSFAAKLLHLYSHRSSLPILLIVLYTPTFFLPDVILILFTKFIYRQDRGKICKIFGGLYALFTVTASASQISFYMTTGGEVQWMAAGNLAKDPGGLRMLLSELPKFFICILAFTIVSWLIAPRFDAVTTNICKTTSLSFRQMYRCLRGRPQLNEYQPLDENSDKSIPSREEIPSLRKSAATCVTVLTIVITVLILQIVRPRNPPYAHMSGSLPITLFESLFFSPINGDFCLPYPTRHVEFPFEEYAKVSGHAPPAEWKPITEECRHHHHHHERPDEPPSPIHPIAWEEAAHAPPTPRGDGPPRHGHDGGYDPSCDPLKLSNLDQSPLDALMEAAKIKHVLFVTLESTRKDMFPFKKDSAVYNSILSSYGAGKLDAAEELDKKLKNLTRTAAFLTGESTGFGQDETLNRPWASEFKAGHGGINVQRAVTGSAFTLKSLVTSHCGIDPLPVDFTEEVRGRMYQPCFPHVTGLFNKAQKPGSSASHPWDAALVQSITDQWDSQYTLDDQMGFSPANVILDTTIEDPSAAHFPPKEPRCNYFGYPETESLPYLRDMFVNATRSGRRLWASHITSTTHHPYAVPAAWDGVEEYVAKRRFAGLENEEFDRYLNTIKYQDGYLDTLMTMLHEVGVLRETLVVVVGDHGLAFTTPDGSKSTFENGHVANFAIPLIFVNPSLPRVQVDAQTSPTSILPTVLDILLQTKSLSEEERGVAEKLLPRYQGQSMAREQKWSVPTIQQENAPTHPPFTNVTGPQPFHFSVINPGGSLLAISQQNSSYRLMLPLCSTLPLRFTDRATSPHETEELIAWSSRGVVDAVRKKHGGQAAEWVDLAQKLGEWWVWETRKRWGYDQPARSTDRGAAGTGAAGRIKKEHWWET
ncbi:hypothetical protein DBV05_g8066 [Lasiodiplodia theobromae]|uniref:Sulfatase N-terminal domain-containing protein n=1 Tax=Lasiodiplodia theobromae TaxID=45133 RepID=A0A5N5D692_9PEZI|nr:hypothetical protein DBV05_g8066 [Lasiodiplodia theobromae]